MSKEHLNPTMVRTIRKIVSDGREPVVNGQGTANAASFLTGPIAPGELVSIFGTGIGPEQGAGGQLDLSGRIASTLADTRVWIDELAAPLLFVRNDQIIAQVPYGVAARTIGMMQVEHLGALSNPVPVELAAAAPGIFAMAGGNGQGAIFNADQSLNSSARPASRGSAIVFFATGAGSTNPPEEDGKLSEPPYAIPRLPIAVRIGGLPAEIDFAAAARGAAGLLQVSARIPPTVVPGSAVSLVLQIGNAVSQPGITLAVN